MRIKVKKKVKIKKIEIEKNVNLENDNINNPEITNIIINKETEEESEEPKNKEINIENNKDDIINDKEILFAKEISLEDKKEEKIKDDNLKVDSKKEDKEDINQNNIEEPDEGMIKLKSQVKCEFPVSSILFSPHEQNKNLLISTSDLLNLYSYEDEQLNLKVALKRKYKDYCGPFTSCDWSRANNAIIGVSSVDKTCSIYDLNKSEEKYMIIAHDKEVYDISLGQDEFIFMSTGADGSVRLFDSRQANSSSIIFETNNESAMTRLKWNLVNPNFILIVTVDKNIIYILDQRKLSYPYAVLKVHKDVVNNAIWAPQSNTNLISVSDDKSALIWDIYSDDSNKPEEYIMEYNAENEIENVAWGDITQNWIGLIDGNQAEVLRIQ